MSYIVFDLEWNQPANEKKTLSESKSIFEIIEIGAVKLDDKGNIIAEFSQLVKPQIYKKLNWHTQKMLNIRMADLSKGETFPKVIKRFLKWCGENPVFLSWGSQDLTELQHNMDYYNLDPLAEGPIGYYDVQKIYGKYIGEEDSSRSLESAIDHFEIEKDIPFHRAFADAYYTAKVLNRLDKKLIESCMVYNIYRLPKNKQNEISKRQGDEYIYITKGYKDRSEISESRRILAMNCPECLYRPVRPKVRWFSTNAKVYYGAAICREHGAIKGKLRIKKHLNGLYYAEKILTYTNAEEVNDIKMRKNKVKKKSTVKEDNNNG